MVPGGRTRSTRAAASGTFQWSGMKTNLEFDIVHQPDDASCGPTCLHAVYRYFGDEESALETVIDEVVPLETGGTLAALLGTHALRRGYSATIYTYNLQIFDPCWFEDGVDIADKLVRQAKSKRDPRLRFATRAYLEFLSLRGRLHHEELRPSLLRKYLERRIPILAGLSATYLYGSSRERGGASLEYDDIRGIPTGHFVVLCGHDEDTGEVLVADPLRDNPRYSGATYRVGMQRLLGAIMLGVLTYDGNLLILEPPDRARPESTQEPAS